MFVNLNGLQFYNLISRGNSMCNPVWSNGPPLQRYYRQLLLFVVFFFVGITGKSVTWLPEVISGELIPWDYRKVWPGLSAV